MESLQRILWIFVIVEAAGFKPAFPAKHQQREKPAERHRQTSAPSELVGASPLEIAEFRSGLEMSESSGVTGWLTLNPRRCDDVTVTRE
ncbi:hypothetical protein EYF80_039119 [Liparis tanakae]|uniref:Uncharacterized protein n=1 Tax=Liparis tanakae TaxID=230148 RepID=A0A4Z2GBC3_9TELE|nr:hypothetical protein EYF80_039119 [Liparis tanakae]